MIFIIKSVDSMSFALSKTFYWIFIEIEFYKHIDLQKNRNDIKFLSDELYGKERYRSGLKQTAFACCQIKSALLYRLRLHIKRRIFIFLKADCVPYDR